MCFSPLASALTSVLAASAFTGSAAFGASTFFSAAAGAGAVTLAAGAVVVAGAAVPWAKEAEAKPAATARAITVLIILNLLNSWVISFSGAATLQRHVPNNAARYRSDVSAN